MTKDELEKSIANGDQRKQQHMLHLIQGLPFHSEEIEAIEELSRKAATTQAPSKAPEIPDELRQLLSTYGLLDGEGKPVQLSPLPIADNADHPSSLLANDNIEIEPVESLEDLHHKISQAALVDAKDYESFKPINGDAKNMSSDMEAFLKQFGLLEYNENDSRKRKSVKNSHSPSNSGIPSIDSAYLLPGYSSLLDNIGIATVEDKVSVKKVNAKPNNFKPVIKNKAAEEDYKKLEQLLETIRELERLNASLTEKEVEKLNLNNFNLSEKLLAAGPDPLHYHIQYSALKNEVKRQSDEPTRVSLALGGPLLESSLEATEDSVDDDGANDSVKKEEKKKPAVTTTEKPSTTTSEKPATTTTTTTTEEPSSVTEEKKNSLEDEIEPIEDPEPLPPPRRSGFYMLLDWNSFLEVGEDPDKISVRFDPKIGDPSRFLPVSVP